MQNHKPFILWLFGVPGSGKSTIANQLAHCLAGPLQIIDSDDIRSRITPNPQWTDEERHLVYRAMWEIATTLYRHQISSIIAASAGGVSLDEYQRSAPPSTVFVYLKCELETAAARHPRRLYALASSQSQVRLPIIVGLKSQSTMTAREMDFTQRHGIVGYKITIPAKVDLELDTTSETSLQDNIDRIMLLINEKQ